MSAIDHEAILATIGFQARTILVLREENTQLRKLIGIPPELDLSALPKGVDLSRLAEPGPLTNGSSPVNGSPATDTVPAHKE